MNEPPLCELFLQAIQRWAAGRQVRRVELRVGILHRIIDSEFCRRLSERAVGTEVEWAEVELVHSGARAICLSCHQRGEVLDPLARCPACDGPLSLSGGDELSVVRLDFAEEPCPVGA